MRQKTATIKCDFHRLWWLFFAFIGSKSLEKFFSFFHFYFLWAKFGICVGRKSWIFSPCSHKNLPTSGQQTPWFCPQKASVCPQIYFRPLFPAHKKVVRLVQNLTKCCKNSLFYKCHIPDSIQTQSNKMLYHPKYTKSFLFSGGVSFCCFSVQ